MQSPHNHRIIHRSDGTASLLWRLALLTLICPAALPVLIAVLLELHS